MKQNMIAGKLFLFLMLFCQQLWGQDMFFTHFYGNYSFHNPSLVGYDGSESIGIKYKNQWYENGEISAFHTGQINIEESVPCSIFDYGLNFNFDQEGPGQFRTYDLGFKFAASFPVLGYLRIGGLMQFSQKRINYDNLIFSDELDSKYSIINDRSTLLPGSFVPPNDGRSKIYFTPSVGFSHQFFINKGNKVETSILWGLAVHNAISIFGNANRGSVESVLGLETDAAIIPVKYAAFVEGRIIPFSTKRYFFTINPLLFYQQQSEFEYFEGGFSFSYNNKITAGAFYHANKRTIPNVVNANWLSFSVEFGFFPSKQRRIDLGFAYSTNTSGLKNYVNDIMEISVRYHLARSQICIWMKEDVPYDERVKCWIPIKNEKLYRNVWYKKP